MAEGKNDNVDEDVSKYARDASGARRVACPQKPKKAEGKKNAKTSMRRSRSSDSKRVTIAPPPATYWGELRPRRV